MSDNEKETIPTNKKDGGGDATSGKKAAGDTEKDTAGTSTDGSAPAMPIISPGANPMTMGQVPTAMMSGQFAPNMMDFSAATEPSAQLAAQAMMRKRQLEMAGDDFAPTVGAKRAKAEEDASKQASDGGEREDAASPNSYPHNTPIPASKEGIKFYSRNDVLCGRGGGTNVHPGNRRFRDLINANRRAYLKARKNDKPAISRSIVRTIREMNGRFLKKDEKQGLWYEVGDDGAREKTSQALRQRAPEMRKILFEDEQRQQHAHQEAMMQRQLMGQGMHPGMMGQGMQMQGMQGRMGMHPGMMGGMNMGGMNPGMMGGMNPGMMGGMMGGMNPGMMGGGMGMGMGMGMGTMNAENFATMSSMQASAGMTNGMPSAGGNGVGEDPQAMMTKYNMLQQKNLLAQEKAMLMQRLAGISNQQNSIDNLSQGTKNPGAVV